LAKVCVLAAANFTPFFETRSIDPRGHRHFAPPSLARPCNGLDPHPPPIAPTPAKTRRAVKPSGARASEQRLLTAMRETPASPSSRWRPLPTQAGQRPASDCVGLQSAASSKNPLLEDGG
jgi:hypothetical protein